MAIQLDLFLDSPRVIRKGKAKEMLETLDVSGALTVYDDLLRELPGDVELIALRQGVQPWIKRLQKFHAAPEGVGRLHELWLFLTADVPPAVISGVRRLLIAGLERLPSPELVYVPPDFHIGVLFLQEGRYAEAQHWFSSALSGGMTARARFLVWLGTAQEALGGWKEGRNSYRDAFLEDPKAIDPETLGNVKLEDLYASLEAECGDELDLEEVAAWIPVWGWLQNAFILPRQKLSFGECLATLERIEKSGSMSPPRFWFECLHWAEHLRTALWNHPDMVPVRRKMQRLNAPMFQRYLKKIAQEG